FVQLSELKPDVLSIELTCALKLDEKNLNGKLDKSEN
ncbi:hypothetical protein scyTo_0026135, partial [Scyliorhinus torazame]|nr:hypothetical protein [Scyliorhinus torazame]